MRLNCKPGDLAVIVKAPKNSKNLGRFVRCVAFEGLVPWTCDGGKVRDLPTWRIDVRLGRPITHEQYRDWDWLISDELLRPIRDPGEDARDETLEWLPVPSRESEAA